MHRKLQNQKKYFSRFTLIPTIVLACAIAIILSCTNKEATAKPKIIFKKGTKEGVIAKIAGVEITEDELIGSSRLSFYEIKKKEYDFKLQRLKSILTDRLISKEADQAKMSKADFISKRIVKGKVKPSSKDFNRFLKEKQVDQSKVTPQLKERIMAYLSEQKREEKIEAYVSRLTKKNPVEAYFTKPKLGMNISTDGAPTWGNKSAKVTIIEFSDFQCPFCARAAKTMAQIKKTYKGKVKIAFKHFPLPFHKDAKPASEAAMCINEQSTNKFWKFYNTVFKNQKTLDAASLEKYAKQSGVNMDKFKACRDSSKFSSYVSKDIAYGEKIGVRSTPTFFVNGELVTGAVPFEKFAEVIDTAIEDSKN